MKEKKVPGKRRLKRATPRQQKKVLGKKTSKEVIFKNTESISWMDADYV